MFSFKKCTTGVASPVTCNVLPNVIAWSLGAIRGFGIPVLSLGFGLLSLPIMQKHQIKKD